MTKKLTRFDLQTMKEEGRKAVLMTAYDYMTAKLAEEAGMDMLLVGDSLGMAVYGYPGTVPVTMDQCICHAEAVRRGAPETLVIGDMPFGSYHAGIDDACRNAIRFYKEAGVDCLKLEGGKRVVPVIKAIVDGGMLLMGHIGLTPQSSGALGGFKAQGRTAAAAEAIVEDAIAVCEAGAFSVLVEGVPPEVTVAIRRNVPVPVYGIGAGDCDGQIMVCSDILGLFQAFTPKFVKRYGNVAEEYRKVFAAYSEDVRKGAFPGEEHVYRMAEGEAAKLAGK
ncbi:MAG: 3-methyl-2-oxobutanoate hydroxymethyltransferase [Syntrophales bacterium]|jgi:3-methyl-2-oxobutanoate hydroxymethyltransferase|nr:3-methyl-2-oxobutanoate hydroxymethyltransferase [Syntrophales bacterium]